MAGNFDLIKCCSIAARKNGVPTISSFEDGSKQASVYSTLWLKVLNQCLDSSTWQFTIITEALGDITLTDPPADPQWTHTFELPESYTRVHKVQNRAGVEMIGDWTIEGSKLYAKTDYIILKYSRDYSEADFPALPSWFINFFISSLAYEAEPALLNRQAVKTDLFNEMGIAFRNGIRINASEKPGAVQRAASRWRAVRTF